jgi:hypothetical protein
LRPQSESAYSKELINRRAMAAAPEPTVQRYNGTKMAIAAKPITAAERAKRTRIYERPSIPCGSKDSNRTSAARRCTSSTLMES